MALFPASTVVLVEYKPIESFLDSAASIWLWLGFVIFVSLGVWSWFKVAPRVPLSVSIPFAVVAWSVCLWLGWTHSPLK